MRPRALLSRSEGASSISAILKKQNSPIRAPLDLIFLKSMNDGPGKDVKGKRCHALHLTSPIIS